MNHGGRGIPAWERNCSRTPIRCRGGGGGGRRFDANTPELTWPGLASLFCENMPCGNVQPRGGKVRSGSILPKTVNFETIRPIHGDSDSRTGNTLRRLFALGFGMILGGILVFSAFQYHLVRTDRGFFFIKKRQTTLDDAYVDIRKWEGKEWKSHPTLVEAVGCRWTSPTGSLPFT